MDIPPKFWLPEKPAIIIPGKAQPKFEAAVWMPGFKHKSGVAPSTATWNPSDKGAGWTLSGGNLIATHSGSFDGLRSTPGSTLKIYCEAQATTISGTMEIGIADSDYVLSQEVGDDTNACSWRADTGYIRYNGGNTYGSIYSATTSDRLGLALDPTNKKVWFRKIGSNWNNDVIANQDPASNIGGFSVAGLNATIFLAAANGASGVFRMYPSQADWTGVAPTGFVQFP